MAYAIVDGCVNCWACHDLCPTGAIYEARPHFLIDPMRCSECEGAHAEPQCGGVCPIEGAILDGFGSLVNPPGSLTGIAPDRLDQVKAEIAAR